MVFAKNAWDHDPILAHTHTQKKKHLHLKSLAAEASKTEKKNSLSILEAILLS